MFGLGIIYVLQLNELWIMLNDVQIILGNLVMAAFTDSQQRRHTSMMRYLLLELYQETQQQVRYMKEILRLCRLD